MKLKNINENTKELKKKSLNYTNKVPRLKRQVKQDKGK